MGENDEKFSTVWRILNLKLIANIFIKIVFPRLWRDWWYWNTTEDRFLAFIQKTATRGDPASVMAAMDKYNQEQEWTIILNPEKRAKVEEVVREASPKLAFEMGCYCGFSAVAIGSQLPAGSRLITVEADPKYAEVARQIVQFAGLDQVITVVTGKAENVIADLHSEYSVDKLDFVFIDHVKSLYYPDLKLLEKNKLLRKGTVVMTDNTLFPGAPDYLQYVESCDKYKTERFYFMEFGFDELDAVTVSVYSGDDPE